MSNAKGNGQSETERKSNGGLPEPKRFPGEPPVRFPYDRELVCDVLAWDQASPNFYMGEAEEAYSRERFRVVVDPSMTDVPQQYRIRADRIAGSEDDPQADPEDTDAVLEDYLRWRRRYAGLGNARQYLGGEPRPGAITSTENMGYYHRRNLEAGAPRIGPAYPPKLRNRF